MVYVLTARFKGFKNTHGNYEYCFWVQIFSFVFSCHQTCSGSYLEWHNLGPILSTPNFPLMHLLHYSVPVLPLGTLCVAVTYFTIFWHPIFIYPTFIFSSTQRMRIFYPLSYHIILASKLPSTPSLQKTPLFYYVIYITHSFFTHRFLFTASFYFSFT